MRLTLLWLVACGAKDPVETDGSGPSDTDTDTDSDTDTDTDTDAPGPRDGTWVGDLVIDATESGFAYWAQTCEVPLTVVIDAGAVPVVSGAADCPFDDPMSGVVTVTVSGEISGDPVISGTVRVERGGMVDETVPLVGSFSGADTANLTFLGEYQSGDYAFTWDATATLAR